MTSGKSKKKSNETEINPRKKSFSFVKMTLPRKPKLKRLMLPRKIIFSTLPTPPPLMKLRIMKFTAPPKAPKKEADFTKMPKKSLANSVEYLAFAISLPKKKTAKTTLKSNSMKPNL